MRPKSIQQFALVYALVILANLAATVLNWDVLLAQVAAQPTLARVGPTILFVSSAIAILIPLLLWYFITQRGSAAAKWILVVITVLVMLYDVLGLASTGVRFNLVGMLGLAMLALQAVAIWLLFRPDSRVWFGENDTADVA